MVQTPFFREGGMWASPRSIKTWSDFWRSTGASTARNHFLRCLLMHVCFDAFVPELVSGPRAIGTIGCLVASFAVAGKQSMHWLDLAAAAAASDVCVADCITLRSSGVISFCHQTFRASLST